MEVFPPSSKAGEEIPTADYDFGFGLEAEYLLAERGTYRPLWYPDVSFRDLNEALESVPLEGLPEMEGLYPNPPHGKIMPFVVEGYHVHDAQNRPVSILPKGPEIRTPKAKTIHECLSTFRLLHQRMQVALARKGYVAVALSHHPVADDFEGPQEGRDPGFWLWAKQAMVTYGPDINVSLPKLLRPRLDLEELGAKVDYYAPALTALSLASPFHRGQLWRPPGRRYYGKAVRTFKRSVVAPPIEIHPEQSGRLEFKTFEMSCRLDDFHSFFLLWLELLLDDGLPGRAGRHSRIYDLGTVAQTGLNEDFIRERASEVIERAVHTLPKWGFNPAPLEEMACRIESRTTPADQMIESFQRYPSLTTLLRERSQLLLGLDGTLPEQPRVEEERAAPYVLAQ